VGDGPGDLDAGAAELFVGVHLLVASRHQGRPDRHQRSSEQHIHHAADFTRRTKPELLHPPDRAPVWASLGNMSGKSAKLKRRQDKSAAEADWAALDLRMLQDDINWIASMGEASQSNPQWKGIIGLVLTPHMARIVHEGMVLLWRRRPTQVQAVALKFAPQIEAARHTVKLLDDTKKLYEGVIQDFERIDGEHSNAWSPGRNFGMGIRDGRVFSTSRSSEFQQSGRLAERRIVPHDYSKRFGYDIGRAAALILRQFGHAPQFTPLPVKQWGEAPSEITLDRAGYYETRFEPEFPTALKDVLCVIEGSVNSCLHAFKPVEGPFTNPVFRVQFVTVSHALNALDEVRNRYPQLAETPGMVRISSVIDSSEAVNLRSLRKLRNRCMHYLIPPTLSGLGEHLPLYGLVESTCPGQSFEIVDAEVQLVLAALSDALRSWKQK